MRPELSRRDSGANGLTEAKTASTIAKVADEAKFRAKRVSENLEDPKGLRVAGLVQKMRRLHDLFAELDPLPSGVTPHEIE